MGASKTFRRGGRVAAAWVSVIGGGRCMRPSESMCCRRHEVQGAVLRGTRSGADDTRRGDPLSPRLREDKERIACRRERKVFDVSGAYMVYGGSCLFVSFIFSSRFFPSFSRIHFRVCIIGIYLGWVHTHHHLVHLASFNAPRLPTTSPAIIISPPSPNSTIQICLSIDRPWSGLAYIHTYLTLQISRDNPKAVGNQNPWTLVASERHRLTPSTPIQPSTTQKHPSINRKAGIRGSDQILTPWWRSTAGSSQRFWPASEPARGERRDGQDWVCRVSRCFFLSPPCWDSLFFPIFRCLLFGLAFSYQLCQPASQSVSQSVRFVYGCTAR